jgi:hypothetical protein
VHSGALFGRVQFRSRAISPTFAHKFAIANARSPWWARVSGSGEIPLQALANMSPPTRELVVSTIVFHRNFIDAPSALDTGSRRRSFSRFRTQRPYWLISEGTLHAANAPRAGPIHVPQDLRGFRDASVSSTSYTQRRSAVVHVTNGSLETRARTRSNDMSSMRYRARHTRASRISRRLPAQ